MRLDPAFKAPLAGRQLRVEGFDGLLLRGGRPRAPEQGST
jgi:hypothetical protein